MSWIRTTLIVLGLLHLGCANTALDRARAQLYCSRIRLHTQPPVAIEGDEVKAIVPLEPHSTCTVHPEVVGENRLISIRMMGEHPCRVSAELGSAVVGVTLGTLPAGDYILQAGALEHAFTVHPPNTPVGPVPVKWQVAIAVVQKFAVSRCSGDPPMLFTTPPERVRRTHPLLFRQVHMMYPGLSDEEVADLIDSATYVDVLNTGGQDFKYTLTEGLCCESKCRDGRAHVQASGNVDIGGTR